MPPTAAHPYSADDLEVYAQTTRAWLQAWVDTASNPFIHAHLYKTRYPPCVQDAYLAATTYTRLWDGRGVTPARKQMVHRTVEEKMRSLLADNAVPSGWSSLPDLMPSCVALQPLDDPLEHTARVHALLTYQLIGLFEDENVPLRRLAERHIPVLYLWMRCMVQCCARQAEFLGEWLTSPGSGRPSVADGSPPSFTARPGGDELVWHSWVLAECVRRTWVVISGIQAVYVMVQGPQQHQNGLFDFPECMGGMMVTTRKGPWEADSAQEWLGICAAVNVGLVQMAEAHTLFSQRPPPIMTTTTSTMEKPNEFIKFALLVGHGERQLWEWGLLT